MRDSADAYKRKPKEEDGFQFGVDGYWVVAPTRHGAHNWELGGRLSAAAAVAAVASLPREQLPSSVGVDAARVLYVGHSMGAHGAWVGAVQGSARAWRGSGGGLDDQGGVRRLELSVAAVLLRRGRLTR